MTGALLLLPSALIYLPSRAVQNEMGLKRSLENWAVTPGSFLASPTHVQTFLLSLVPGSRVLADASAYLFPGYLPLLLAGAAITPRPKFGAGLDSRTAGVHGGSHLPAGKSPDDSIGQPRTDGNAVDRTRPRQNRPARIAAAVLEVASIVLFAIAVTLTLAGPTRLRVGETVIFSSRSAWRPWLLVAVVALARAALLPRVPFDIASRLRRAVRSVRGWRTRTRARQGSVAFYGLLALVSVWLSIGPPLGLWRFVYWLPGFSFIRVPSRFTVLAILGLAIVAGAGFDRLSARFAPRRRVALAVVVAALLVAEFAAMPLAVVPYRVDAPMADRWLETRPTPFAVAEVPLPDPMNAGAFERRQTLYMLHSMAHWQKTVHGYSGWRAPLHERLYPEMRSFPDEASLRSLSGLGVTYVIVHTELYSPGEWPQAEARIDQFGAWLRLEHVAGSGRVYSLREPAGQ